MKLKQLLTEFELQLQEADRVWVAYSGGLDSTVLLHAAVDMLGAAKVGALHLNHRLQVESDEWQKGCQQECESLGVDFRSEILDVSNKGNGIEQAARQLRYQFFRKNLVHGDVLLLGHHADDQAETLLYRLFRGSGVRGLAAIPQERTEGLGLLVRPLLSRTKEELIQLATESNINWIEDPSNMEIGYDRNYIRQNLLPIILDRWPKANLTLARAALNLRSASNLLDEYAVLLLESCNWRTESYGSSFDISAYQLLSASAQALLLERALAQLDLNGFDSSYRIKVVAAIEAAEDANPLLQAGESEMRRYAGRLYLMSKIADLTTEDNRLQWNGKESIVIGGCCELMPIEHYSGGVLSLSFRSGGERCKPLGRDKSQSLKKLMQEYGLVPWLRDRTPLIWRNDELIAVAGIFSCSPDISVPEIVWSSD